MQYSVEMGSGAMIHMRGFIKVGLGIKKLIGGIHRHRHRMDIAQGYFHFFFQNKEYI
jgi:hypothetical protein